MPIVSNSVLFDGSHLAVEENRRQTIEIVAEAKAHGAQVATSISLLSSLPACVGGW
jgi:fructose-bisphosphate aldolase class II